MKRLFVIGYLLLVVMLTHPLIPSLEGNAYGQSRTTPFSLPLWNSGAVLTAGSTNDTSTSNAGINSISLRTDAMFNRWFYKGSHSLRNDSLRDIGFVRFTNGTRLEGYSGGSGLYYYSAYPFYVVPTGTIGQVFYPYGVSAGNTSALVFNELAANGSNYVGFKAPDNISSNKIWTLPNADGTSGQFLKTDGSGVLSFGDGGAGASFDSLYWKSVWNRKISSMSANFPLVATGDTGRVLSVDTTRTGSGTSLVTHSYLSEQNYIGGTVQSGGGRYPNTGATGGTGDVAWTSPSNAVGDTTGLTYASVSLTTGQRSTYLTLTNFKIIIPTDATVTGIVARVSRYYASSGGGVIKDTIIQIVKGGSVSGNPKKNTSNWGTSLSTATYGGVSDLWGTTLTPADVMASNFGIAIVCKDAIAGSAIGYVDWASLAIYYTQNGRYQSFVAIRNTGLETDQDTIPFSIENSSGTPVATVDTNGNGVFNDLTATFAHITYYNSVHSTDILNDSYIRTAGLEVGEEGSVRGEIEFDHLEDVSKTYLQAQEVEGITSGYTALALPRLNAGNSSAVLATIDGNQDFTNVHTIDADTITVDTITAHSAAVQGKTLYIKGGKGTGGSTYGGDVIIQGANSDGNVGAAVKLYGGTGTTTGAVEVYSPNLKFNGSNLITNDTHTDYTLAYWLNGEIRDTTKAFIGDSTASLRTDLYRKDTHVTDSVAARNYSNTLYATTGTDSTLSKAFEWGSVAAAESVIVYRVPCNGLTLNAIWAIRTGGTSASINATRTRAGSTVDLLTANYSVSTSMASAGTVQNNTLQNGDVIKFTIRAISGTLTELFVQLDATRAK